MLVQLLAKKRVRPPCAMILKCGLCQIRSGIRPADIALVNYSLGVRVLATPGPCTPTYTTSAARRNIRTVDSMTATLVGCMWLDIWEIRYVTKTGRCVLAARECNRQQIRTANGALGEICTTFISDAFAHDDVTYVSTASGSVYKLGMPCGAFKEANQTIGTLDATDMARFVRAVIQRASTQNRRELHASQARCKKHPT